MTPTNEDWFKTDDGAGTGMADMDQAALLSLDEAIRQARAMHMVGKYVRGAVFHRMADEIERLHAQLDALIDGLEHHHGQVFSAEGVQQLAQTVKHGRTP